MSLGTLLIYIAIIALVITLAILIPRKGEKNWVMSYLQNFTGVLFLISGWVKAVDPMGTGFKMADYYAEFEATLSGTWFSFMAPVFPYLSEHAIASALFMIILEIIVGLMLILGHTPKITAWIFLAILIMFTILTGFTFLTGYVPGDANFFDFGAWGPYAESNMRVTDCGCFGDFIKLEPRTSFMKDIVLLVPAIYFVLRSKQMHQLFTSKSRSVILAASTVGLLVYCMSNYAWDIPHADFRPFKVGVDIGKTKELEEEAAGSVQVTAWKLKNIASGEMKELPNDEYMANYKSYPSAEWEIIDQVTSKPEIEPTKISDFEILSGDGQDMTYDILESSESMLMIVCYKLYGETDYVEKTTIDSIFRNDTILVDGELQISTVLDRLDKSTITVPDYTWDPAYVEKFNNYIAPLLESAAKDGTQGFVVAGGASADMLSSFAEATNLDCPMYEADDIMLKTIVRSNPGVVLLKRGTILGKWHMTKVPSWQEIKQLTIDN